VNAPPDQPTRISVHTGEARTETFAVCDQYTLQGDAFSAAILNDGEVPVSLEDAFQNMAVIDAVFKSGETGAWIMPERLSL
jgi:predicted dehydrogenase